MDKIMTTAELIEYTMKYVWKRRIDEFHTHHTWKPSYKDFNGNNYLALQQGMRNYHVNTRKWQDIGQHLTLCPDGKWITGRDFNIIPASIEGRNAHALAVEMIGDFDMGKDKMAPAQLSAIVEYWAFCTKFFKRSTKDIIFHREYSPKTCPGSGFIKAPFVALITKKMEDNDVDPVKIIANGKDCPGFIKDGKAFVQVSGLALAIGAKADWNANTKTVTILTGGK